MRSLAILSLAVALALPGCASTQGGSTASVFAQVDESEWSAPGFIHLDLVTGQYELKPQPPRGVSAANVAKRRGTLPRDQLRPIRQAYEAARAEGLTLPACRNGGRPETIVVSNAGPISMILSGEGGKVTTPQERGCWSEAGWRLYRLLADLF